MIFWLFFTLTFTSLENKHKHMLLFLGIKSRWHCGFTLTSYQWCTLEFSASFTENTNRTVSNSGTLWTEHGIYLAGSRARWTWYACTSYPRAMAVLWMVNIFLLLPFPSCYLNFSEKDNRQINIFSFKCLFQIVSMNDVKNGIPHSPYRTGCQRSTSVFCSCDYY